MNQKAMTRDVIEHPSGCSNDPMRSKGEYMRINYSRLALAKLLANEVELLQDLDTTMFTNKEQKIYQLIIEHYADNSKLPSKLTLQAIISNRAPAAVQGPFSAVVESLPDDTSEVPNEELITGLKGARTLRAVDDKMEKLIEAQRNRNFDDVKTLLAETLQEVSLGGVKVDALADVMDNDEIIHSVPSGFGEQFDNDLGNRFSGVTLLTSASGGGKSIQLLASAIEAFKEGQAVLFVSLELSAKALGARLRSYITGLDFNKFIKNNLTSAETKTVDKKMKDFWGDRKDDFKIVTEQVDDKELLAMVAVQAQTSDVRGVYIDYLGLIGSSTAGDSWKSLSNLVKALHKMTISHGIVVCTAAQISEVKIENEQHVSLVSRGSAELVFSSSVVLYTKKMDDTDEEAFVIYQVKNRYARTTHAIMEGRFAEMKFVDTGIRLNA